MRDLIIITIVLYLGFGIGLGVTLGSYSRQVAQQRAIEGGIIVEAEIYGVGDVTTGEHDRHLYGLYYRYVNEITKIEYKGTIVTSITDYEEAQSHKGEKVEIYISKEVFSDGNGISIPVGQKTNAYTDLIVAIVFGVILLSYTAFLCISLLKVKKRKKIAKLFKVTDTNN